ncbi:MAG TPA: hypothetical protein VFQ84_09490 [Arenimonas sp.]|uniref:hypothetical protein n=1 Tax=Arenimonas sp. TaxID=1872635 RepID=UPI002D81141C|nr:hypothetical protein [Arenimonas sp.]HEU0153565.1 hypothetical protein [Arenimonas sp.]
MSSRIRFFVPLASALLIGLGGAAAAAPRAPGAPQAPAGLLAPADTSPLTPAERGELARQLVLKWGYYVQRVHGVPIDAWAERMVPSLIQADPANFRAALQRDTFEGAMAELGGVGQRLDDDAVITKLALADGDGTQALGALANDLVYTPVAPCRILDTRSTAAGAISGNSTRNFIAINASNFTSQGGSATNCGTLGLNATAVAVNLTAVTPDGAGYATAYPFGTAQPVAASINYTGGAIVNNALIVQIPNPLSSFDFTVYTFARSHFVADIVGYFAPPLATAVQCVDTANTTVSGIPAGGTANASAPACPAGYTATATNCEASDWQVPFVFFHAGTCSARNNSASPQDIRASRTCCRVPGR